MPANNGDSSKKHRAVMTEERSPSGVQSDMVVSDAEKGGTKVGQALPAQYRTIHGKLLPGSPFFSR